MEALFALITWHGSGGSGAVVLLWSRGGNWIPPDITHVFVLLSAGDVSAQPADTFWQSEGTFVSLLWVVTEVPPSWDFAATPEPAAPPSTLSAQLLRVKILRFTHQNPSQHVFAYLDWGWQINQLLSQSASQIFNHIQPCVKPKRIHPPLSSDPSFRCIFPFK